MKNWFFISIDQRTAKKYFSSDDTYFDTAEDSRWVVRIAQDDPRLVQLGRECRRIFEDGGIWANSSREYTKTDLANAELFEIHKFRGSCDPASEEVGTIYDESVACPVCGAGGKPVGPLRLALSKVSEKKDFAENYAGEKILSARAVDVFRKEGITGLSPQPVFNGTKEKATSTDWFQFQMSSEPVDVLAPPTWVGTHPFDWDKNEYRCKNGDTLGFRIFSEITVRRPDGPLADVYETKQYFRDRRGLLRPERRILVTPRFRQVVLDHKLKGLEFEVAHFG